MKKIVSLFIMTVAMSACSTQTVKVLDANWTSMKHPMPPAPNQQLVLVSKIQTEYCLASFGPSGFFGLMDEAVKKAETQYEIDYIKYPAFTQSVGKSCVQVSGEGYRVTR
jgi:hypothetical protein